MASKQDEIEVHESVDKALANPNLGIDIQGLEEVPVTLIPIPFVKLVQPTSTKTTLADGKSEAQAGTFFFTDTQVSVNELNFVLLKAKHGNQTYERDGQKVSSPRLMVLGVSRENKKLFILPLSVMSFSNFGKLVAKLKDNNIKSTWRFEITATTEKQENQKGKYYTANFQIGEELEEQEYLAMEGLANQYGIALNRNEVVEEE